MVGDAYYLTKDAIRETLGRVADVAASGSRIVFDYKLARHLIPEESLPFADRLDRFVARRGEPMLSVFTPEELNDEMSQIGFLEIETIPAEEQKRRYLENRSDLVDPAPNFSFALFGVMK
jgi:O-methyltransferase involved in polyketide biosynthesis